MTNHLMKSLGLPDNIKVLYFKTKIIFFLFKLEVYLQTALEAFNFIQDFLLSLFFLIAFLLSILVVLLIYSVMISEIYEKNR